MSSSIMLDGKVIWNSQRVVNRWLITTASGVTCLLECTTAELTNETRRLVPDGCGLTQYLGVK